MIARPVSSLICLPRNAGIAKLAVALLVIVAGSIGGALAASNREPAPAGAPPDAPPQYTRFSTAELTRGFLALAFGSDLRVGARPRGIRRFDKPIRVQVIPGGSVDRAADMQRVLEEYKRAVPNLRLDLSGGGEPADVEIRLIDEKDFRSALVNAFGATIARAFVARTDPQCMTSVQSNTEGTIIHAITFVIVDKGNDVFLDCAYHELLHAFGLSNHDQRNNWTTLNQKRMVGYLTVYDRSLLTLLYDPRITPGMSPERARAVLPKVIESLGLAASPPTRKRR